MKREKPYRIIGAYDSETTNYDDKGQIIAFPILHQLGLLSGDTQIIDVDSENVERVVSIDLYRHAIDLFAALDEILAIDRDYVPVLLCHNLAFDMYGISQWLMRHDVRVLAKSARKPITFTVLDDSGNPALVIWDSLIFSQQSLERMGDDCGYSKAVGEWDYSLIRTPQTPLTPDEIDYAQKDIYTLLVWFGWWLRRNPDIKPERLALNVVTKTGVVRERRRVRFDGLRGNGLNQNVGRFWLYRCRTEQPKDDDELYTMMAATRGGFTFCASEHASKAFDFSQDDDFCVAGYDATSQHPAQICSHYYPVNFAQREPYILDLAFELISKYPVRHVLKFWDKPFSIAFYACFEFENLRPKAGSIFAREGIMPLASARFRTPEQIAEDNGDKPAYDDEMVKRAYCDVLEDATCAFGKIVSAKKARLYITELTAWEICQAYDYDNVRAVHGYMSGRFTKPSDMDTISIMQFYEAKDEFKLARETFYETGTIRNGAKLESLGIAPAIIKGMESGELTSGDVEALYLSLKADLNSVFGISCSNQYRRKTILTQTGIEYEGNFGVCNAPKNPKVWYQFGQRIVGWSRIAQICAMLLMEPYIEHIVNGDTDSVKVVCRRDNLGDVDMALQRLSDAIDKGKAKVCRRVKVAYPEFYNPLDGIGYYVREFVTDRFCASWNKAYTMHDVGKDGKRHFAFTLAGIPTRRRSSKNVSFIGLNGFADRLYDLGWSFEEICNLLLGYNVTLAHDVIRMNARKFPEWASSVYEKVTDYKGEIYTVAEPSALAIYPMSKTINDTASFDNRGNMIIATRNNPDVNILPKLVYSGGVMDFEEVF